jgi:predicted O-methyltransferase YrrM
MLKNVFKNNLLPRLSLLRTALTRRFIYSDVVRMARSYGVEYRDVTGDIEPFEFVAAASACDGDLFGDFSSLQKDAALFSIEGVPDFTNSEPSVARFIAKLVFRLRAQTVIELGSFSGWTSVHIASALRLRNAGGQLYCVELHEKHIEALKRNLERYSLNSLVKVVRGNSLDEAVVDQLPSCADLIFLDTSHTYPATRDEILTYLPRLAPTGSFVLHDSISAVGVRKSLSEIPRDLRRLSFATEAGNGVTVLLRDDFFKTQRRHD